jgi:hypothetical protein
MALADLMQRRAARPAGSPDNGRQTRINRFTNLVKRAFAETPEDLDMTLEDKGPGVSVEGRINYNGRTFTLTYGAHEGRGKWWYLNGQPLFQHQGRSSTTHVNLAALLNALGNDGVQAAPQTQRLYSDETNN